MIFDYWLDNRFSGPSSYEYNKVYLQSITPVLLTQFFYYTKLKKSLPIKIPFKATPTYRKDLIIYSCFALILILYLIIKYGFTWLAPNRSIAASLIAPEFRYFFPLLVFISLTFYFRQNLEFSKTRIFPLILFFIISGIFFTLFSARGYLVYMILFSIPYLRNKSKILPLLGFFYLIFTVFILRLIGENGFDANASYIIASNGDAIDTWFIVNDFVQKNGLLYGKGIIGNVFNLIPLSIRENLPIRSSWDLLNLHYFGDEYLNSSFGYNLNVFQELFMNFGYTGLAFFPILGRMLGQLDLKINALRQTNQNGVYTSILLMRVQTLLAFGTFQWLIMFEFLRFFHKNILNDNFNTRQNRINRKKSIQ